MVNARVGENPFKGRKLTDEEILEFYDTYLSCENFAMALLLFCHTSGYPMPVFNVHEVGDYFACFITVIDREKEMHHGLRQESTMEGAIQEASKHLLNRFGGVVEETTIKNNTHPQVSWRR